MSSILNGYTSQATAYEVKDYPYGYTLRTSIFYWIESKAGHGDRLCTYTINPKTGKANKPKCGTYSTYLYLYLDSETGHVKTGGIDAYNQEYFKMRFGFLINKIGEVYISEVQQQNIRRNYVQHLVGNAIYEKVKYSPEMQPVFLQWVRDTIKHVKTCPFAELVDHPEAPAQDNPDGEMKFTIAERVEKPEEQPAHNITAESVTELLQKTIPGFCVSATDYTGFSEKCIKISIAVGENKLQRCTLLLNLKTLVLRVQYFGGEGGQCIYRDIDPTKREERFLAMKGEKVFFRTPQPNEKDVLRAIERFALNYRDAILKFKDVLKGREHINFEALTNKQTA